MNKNTNTMKKIFLYVVILSSLTGILFLFYGLYIMENEQSQDGSHVRDFSIDCNTSSETISLLKAEEFKFSDIDGLYRYGDRRYACVRDQLEDFQRKYDDIVKNNSEENVRFSYHGRSRFEQSCDVDVAMSSKFIIFHALLDEPNPRKTNLTEYDFFPHYQYKWTTRSAMKFNGSWITNGEEDCDQRLTIQYSNVFLVESHIFYQDYSDPKVLDDASHEYRFHQYMIIDQEYEPLIILFYTGQL